jgi:putative Mg2+ transporter-C (MgtC) family protein
VTAVDLDLWQIGHAELGLRLLLAVVLGGLVGMERELSNHAAGFRTHILVCLGSATIMLLSIYGFSAFVDEANVRMDPARLAAQVISGIGFLGAGAIVRDGNVVKGLTTAASVWVVAAIGLCVGAGFFAGAFVATFMSLVSLFVLNKWEKRLPRNRRFLKVELRVIGDYGVLGRIMAVFGSFGVQIDQWKVESDQGAVGSADQLPVMNVHLSLRTGKPEHLMAAYGQIVAMKGVILVQGGGIPAGKPDAGTAAETTAEPYPSIIHR